eukprot:CAMPEP_0198133432 /NCGR_PEP_ID=MMETSP1442-20131203/59561_1 /TAXON_ID= /ORGANISM="Craspedostauros australis, Strain CCMP3328" /LENGTH=173 /DNA_ID=CAMNT_0043794549 /DNA_START=500 /DNA_END=1021 /DNA_ORIENTATION=+
MRYHLALSCLLLAAGASATPSPSGSKNCAAKATGASPTNDVFGISSAKRGPVAAQRLAPLLDLRGGEVFVADTLDEVDAIVLKAASNQQLVIIDFSATWCGPCKAIAPLFEEFSEDVQDALFVKVDVDDNPETAAKYSVSAMPTFLFIKEGEVVDRLMGANPQRLQELILEHL